VAFYKESGSVVSGLPWLFLHTGTLSQEPRYPGVLPNHCSLDHFFVLAEKHHLQNNFLMDVLSKPEHSWEVLKF